MAYKQVRDIMQRAQSLKGRLEKICADYRENTDDEINRELLNRVKEHQSRVQWILEKHQQHASQGVLDTWIQFSGFDRLERAMIEMGDIDSDGGVEVVERVIEADNALFDVIEVAARQAQAPRVKEYFQVILDVEDSEARTTSRAVIEAQDLRREN